VIEPFYLRFGKTLAKNNHDHWAISRIKEGWRREGLRPENNDRTTGTPAEPANVRIIDIRQGNANSAT
jgi:hypothetical protein